MLAILSPSKTQDFENYNLPEGVEASTPLFLKDIQVLIKKLKQMTPDQISKLMSLSDSLTDLNFQRFQDFNPNQFTAKNSKPALLAFQGDVYRDIPSKEYSKQDWEFANQHLRIISGLYGLLKPTDQIQPYRLEMKTKLKTSQSKDLYEFWDQKLAKQLESESHNTLINLASNEYSKALIPHLKNTEIINISFKDKKKDKYRVIAIYSKFARGNMANQIIKQRLTKPEQLKQLDINGYKFNKSLSTDKEYVFTRD
jgi:hypothetical protein